MPFLPNLKDIGYLILAAALAIGGSWLWGKFQYHRGAADQRQLNHTEVVLTQKISKQATQQVITKYITQTKVIHEKGQEIIKKVPYYVTIKDDSSCVIPNGFVRLWNSANEMQFPSPATSVDEEASAVTLSDTAAEHAEESERFHENAAQLEALQEWVREQQSIYSQ